MRVGSQVVFSNLDDPVSPHSIPYAAAGVTIVASVDSARRIRSISTYLLTLGDSDVIETVEALDLDVSVDQDSGTISFVMPEWNAEEGQFPIMHIERGVG